MTRIEWLREAGDSRMVLRARGHSGAGAYGQDIVCAAVSVAMELLDANLTVFGARRGVWKESGVYELVGEGYTAYKLMSTTAAYLRALAYQYPENLNFTEKILQNRIEWGENGKSAGI